MSRLLYFTLIAFSIVSCSSTQDDFERSMKSIEKDNPFHHELDIRYSKGTSKNILLLSHGFGGNSQSIIDRVRPNTSDTIIGFNYIDHDFSHATGDDRKTSLATPLEFMPLIYMLKKCVVENNMSTISLYGYALGASDIIYAISFLSTVDRDDLLKKYNITASDKIRILDALRKGKILLDDPFKSIDEMIAFRGPTEILLMYKERANKNNVLSPVDTLAKLKDLNMTFLLFFDIKNEEFFNRDDSNFAKNLIDANANGTNVVITADNGGHTANHHTLWKINSCLK